MMQDAASGTGVGAGADTGVGACFLDVLTGFIADGFSSGGCESPQMGVSFFLLLLETSPWN